MVNLNFISAILQHLPYSLWTIRLKYLFKVYCNTVIRHRAVTEHSIERMLLGYGYYDIFGYILIEASNQIAICYRENILSSDFCLLYL